MATLNCSEVYIVDMDKLARSLIAFFFGVALMLAVNSLLRFGTSPGTPINPPLTDSAFAEIVKTQYNQQLQKEKFTLRCTDVRLTKESPNKYIGAVTLSDGKQCDVVAKKDARLSVWVITRIGEIRSVRY